MSYQILKAVIANMLKELKKTVSRAEKRYNENVQSKRKDQHTDEKKKNPPDGHYGVENYKN